MAARFARFPATVWIDTAVLAVLAAIGMLGFAVSYSGWGFLLAGLGGLAVGLGAALLAAWLRFGVLLSALVAVVAYFLFGSAFAMPEVATAYVVPNLDTLWGLADGAVRSWADVLTISAPVQAPDYIAVMPYLAGVLVGFAGTTMAARWFAATPRTAPTSLVALILPIALYVWGIAIGTEQPYLAAVRGLAFAGLALVWLAWRPRTTNSAAQNAGVLIRRRVVGTSIVVVAALAVGGVVGFAAEPVQADRFVLRDRIVPPFDPLAYPSPLSGFRKYTKDLDDEVLFTVQGLQEGDRLRIASMDTYNGQIVQVMSAQQDSSGSGAFKLIGGSGITLPPLLGTGESRTITVGVQDYTGFWLPEVGYPTDVEFSGDQAPDSTSVRHADSTGVIAIASGLRSGIEYTQTGVVPVHPDDVDLADVGVANIALPPVSNVPDILAGKAVELAGTATAPIDQLRRIESALKGEGYLSHGSASDQAPSVAGHGADRLKAMFERAQWIGDEEQYATAFVLMARSLGYPARVVMGFAPEVTGSGPIEVTGSDVTAWAEVAFDGVGWVAFDPTPTETEVPPDTAVKPKTEPQPQVRQPPSNEANSDDLISALPTNDDDEEKVRPFQIPGWVWVTGGSILIPLAAVFIPMLIVAAVKLARRRRRRGAGTADARAAGAWAEVADGYSELGFASPRTATRSGLARDLQTQLESQTASVAGADRLGALAMKTDEAVFSGRELSQEEIDRIWAESVAALDDGRRAVPFLRRLLSRYRVRPKRDIAKNLAAHAATAHHEAGRGKANP